MPKRMKQRPTKQLCWFGRHSGSVSVPLRDDHCLIYGFYWVELTWGKCRHMKMQSQWMATRNQRQTCEWETGDCWPQCWSSIRTFQTEKWLRLTHRERARANTHYRYYFAPIHTDHWWIQLILHFTADIWRMDLPMNVWLWMYVTTVRLNMACADQPIARIQLITANVQPYLAVRILMPGSTRERIIDCKLIELIEHGLEWFNGITYCNETVCQIKGLLLWSLSS